MYDNGSTITMQSQRNTIYNTTWINALDYKESNTDGTSCSYTSCNDEGPITILNALESATAGWTNVNNQTYTMGTTTFKTNAYTGCSSFSSCAANTYTLEERTVKARMITVQEAADLGCTETQKSCPMWIYNYLQEYTSYGGTINDTTTTNGASSNVGYWTMNANSSIAYNAWYMRFSGNLSHSVVYYSYLGARAVVEINK